MATRAFLLCGDEKAVQAVTQILDELEVSFEHSSEPAFSLKRLSTQRFDLLIVDCDNVQNATQVFNSARASNLNKTSIAIAIVEGKAGVPNAFRLGASLVLTKPVSLEQARNTLRTGIGMSRKDTPEAKPAAPAAGTTPVTPAVTPASVVTPPAAVIAPPVPTAPVPAVTASAAAGTTPATTAPPTTPAATATPARPPVTPTVLTPVAPAATPAPAAPTAAAAKPALSPTAPAEKPAPRATSTPPAPVSEQKPANAAEKKSEPTTGAAAVAKATTVTAPPPAPVKNFDSVFATPILTEKPAPKTTEKPASKTKESKALSSSKAASEEKSSSSPSLSIVDPLAEEDTLDPLKEPVGPTFGGMGSFAGLEPEPQGRGKGLLITAIVVLVLGIAGYAAWLTMPGFRKAVSRQYLNVMSKAGSQEQPSAEAKPVAPSPAPVAVAPAPAPAPATDNTSVDPNASPATNSAATDQTATTPNAPANSATAPVAAPASAENPKSPTVQPAKQDSTNSGANPALKPASASSPSTAAKTASSDLLEIPEDFADDQIVHRVHPNYPKQARARKIHGTVVLQAIVNKQGKVDSLQLVSGDALLAQAAADAVKQWRYKPYSHNGEPADFQTRVTVDFKLP